LNPDRKIDTVPTMRHRAAVAAPPDFRLVFGHEADLSLLMRNKISAWLR
jgi:hypothetical protein